MESKLRIKAYDISRLRVLVVDDSGSMRQLVYVMLRQLGVRTVSKAESGEAAQDMLRAGMFDVMILDWVMPGMSGLELTRAIRREIPGIDRFLPIIMLTGRTAVTDVMKARDAGVSEFISKPASVQSLYTRIVSVIENPRPFISTDTFAGPDRRRVSSKKYDGEERRGVKRSRLKKKSDEAMAAYLEKKG